MMMLNKQIQITLPSWIEKEVDRTALYKDDIARMTLALQLARRNVEMNTGGPFGAAIFNSQGQLIGLGVNCVVEQNCSVAHAEMVAFMHAQAQLQRYRLNHDGLPITLATSAQPCCMCYGASFWAGISELLIGARSEDVHELTEFDEGPLPNDWIGELTRRNIQVKRDVLRQPARDVLQMYQQRGGQSY